MSWISIDGNALSRVEESKENSRGCTYWSASPLDIPQAFQIECAPHESKATIRIRYMTNEPSKKTDHLGVGVELVRGAATNRIYEIIISTDDFTKAGLSRKLLEIAELLKASGGKHNDPAKRAGTFRERVTGRFVEQAPRFAGW